MKNNPLKLVSYLVNFWNKEDSFSLLKLTSNGSLATAVILLILNASGLETIY